MSRVKALQVAQTCVLSTRWRHLWCAVSCLDVDEQEFGTHNNFEDFTTSLLGSHDIAFLDAFRLHATNLGSYQRRHLTHRWVRRAMGLDDTRPCRLRRLHLSGLNLNMEDIASHVSSRCPALEDLELENCNYYITCNINIASSSLKKLVVDSVSFGHDDNTFALVIDTPALVSLCLDGEFEHIVDYREPHSMPSLVDASIHLPVIEDMKPWYHYAEFLTPTMLELNIIGALSNVTSLQLSQFVVMLRLYPDCEDLPVYNFKNLRTLFLDECHISDDFLGLQQYLRNSHNLQKLTFCCCKVSNFGPREELIQRRHSYFEDLADFKCENLRLSEIIYQDGEDDVHLLVKFLEGMRKNLSNNKIELTKVD
ncbi:hypothetical protein CFC21_096392 [Triticum aestivum]|uniref:FBD domain-containing protein n=3 Tax=Triticum aestivum TaxID=4565 RepID=A0A3B6RE74_WHEAT|nr:hypothetical protein CFC21_096392 [Triticum aestivum]